MVERLVDRFDPDQIIRSARRPAARQPGQRCGSVGDHACDRIKAGEKRVEMRVALHDMGAKDILLATPEEVLRYKDVVGTIIRPALREGKVLYARRLIHMPNRSCTSCGQWVQRLKTILQNATHTLKLGEHGSLDTVCFHAQQCVEKYLKAYSVSNEIDFYRTHDITALLTLLPAHSRPEMSEEEQARLGDYAVAMRTR